MHGVMKCRGLLCLFAIAAILNFMPACGGSKPIAVGISPATSVSIDDGQTQNLTATVANDSKSAGVSWTLSGPGALSAQTTSSVTYTAPASGAAATATVTAASVTDATKTASVAIKISPLPTIAATPLPPAGTNGTSYSFTVPESGGTTPLTWSVSVGALPTGLSLNGGVISGTPNANATLSPYSCTVKVVDAAKASTTYSYSLTIANPPKPVISTTAPPAGTNGSAYTSFTFTISSGGLAPFTWSETGALPTGMTFSTSGVLSGTPKASGSFPITVNVQDSSNPVQTASGNFTITINNPPPPTITTTTLPNGTVGTAYSQTVQATGGLAPYTWSVSAGTPPSGLGLNAGTGVLSGTPTTAQSNVAFTIQVKDSLNQTGTHAYTVTISNPPPPTITTTSLPAGTVGTAYNQTIQATGGLGPYTWSSSGTVPPGLKVNTTSTGNSTTVTGNPTTAETGDTFTVQITDSLSQVGSQQYTVNVVAQPIVVTITNKISTIQIGASAVTLNATVQNDIGNQGVTWTLTAGGASCSPTCGSLSNATSTSVEYTPPTSEPAAPNNSPTITATSVADTTKSDTDSFTITGSSTACGTGSESVLTGQYAFSLAGYNSTGFGAVIGSFTADGTGKITAGELDMNGSIGLNEQLAISTTGSSYSLDLDSGGGYRGCLTISTTKGTFTTHFTVGSISSKVATKGRLVEWETGSSAFIATGQLAQQTTSEFSTKLSGNYVFAVMGEDFSVPGAITCMGELTASSNAFGGGEQDCNDVGTVANTQGLGGSYSAADSSGRITAQITSQTNGTSNVVFYMVSSSKLLVLVVDPSSSSPVQSGEVTLQSGTPASTWLNGVSAFALSGTAGSGGTDAGLGLFSVTTSGSGTATIFDWAGNGSTTVTPETVSCTYAVGSDGRTPLAGASCGNHAPILYLTGPNAGYILNTGHSGEIGPIQPQMTGTINTSTISGTYFMGTYAVPLQIGPSPGVGWSTATSGNFDSLSDSTSTTQQLPDNSLSGTITIDATPGGWFDLSTTSHNPSVLVINTTTLWQLNGDGGYPVITILER